jgi:flagellar biosynthesis/type III secretory pathway M-ring protein FliF/YscJ
MEYALALIVLVVVVAAIVLRPLRQGGAADHTEDERRATLEAAKEAKYREIRDAELDYRMGKLSEDDYRATDRELRAQAIEILKAIDELAPEQDADTAGAADDGAAAR